MADNEVKLSAPDNIAIQIGIHTNEAMGCWECGIILGNFPDEETARLIAARVHEVIWREFNIQPPAEETKTH